MTSLNAFQSLPKTAKVYHDFPRRLIAPLRNIVDASSPKEALGEYCSLFDVLLGYLANLGNSVYLAQPPEAANSKIEMRLRAITPPLAMGHKVAGVRIFVSAKLDFEQTLPELGEVLKAKHLPDPCKRMARAFAAVRKGCEEFGIPPTHLRHFIDQQLAASNSPKCSFVALCEELLPIRNKGVAHLDEDSWFPNDPKMFALVCSYLAPAVDELLTWAPMQALLTNYELVELQALPAGTPRRSPVARVDLADGRAPLGTSSLRLEPTHRAEKGARFVARRSDRARELDAVVRYVRFPKTLQSSELLAQRYAQVYLDAYLERGLITPTQRQTKLSSTLKQIALAERDWRQVEVEIQAALNLDSGDDPEQRRQVLSRLGAALGPGWSERAAEVESLLDELPVRREDYVYELIENNTIMSFVELRAETELPEPELDSVLGELEQDDRIRQINTGVGGERLGGYFKTQDPGRPTQLRAILDELRDQRGRRKGYPAALRQLVDLCAKLLTDDGLPLPRGMLDAYADLYADEAGAVAASEDEGSDMVLRVGDDELRGRSVRDLLTQAWELTVVRDCDTDKVVPMLMGKSRYLVARTPEHSNGTPFKIPIHVDDVVFEGNLKRSQALAEAIRLLRHLGLNASSPEIQPPREDEVDEDEAEPASPPTALASGEDDDQHEDDEEGSSGLVLELTVPGADESTRIEGPTVRRFFAALMDFLIRHEAPLDDLAPVATGRVRYLLAEEPYHANARPFDSMIEKGGYFINTAYSYAQALNAAKILVDKLGWSAKTHGASNDDGDATPLKVEIGEETIEAGSVPPFLAAVIEKMFELGLLDESDVPYKSGRVRYLIAETPTHDHGREFLRPVELEVEGRTYFIETNVSRQGALDLVGRLLASKRPNENSEEH